jgi:hypothetical protein
VAIDSDLQHPVLLLITISVHFCSTCHQYFRAQPPFLRPDASYTNRVVQKAIQSVYRDGMAFRRAAERLARDFWVQPSEGSLRRWCRIASEQLDLPATISRGWCRSFRASCVSTKSIKAISLYSWQLTQPLQMATDSSGIC